MGEPATNEASAFLVCALGSAYCAIPLDSVVETMRPLPIEPIAGQPEFVLGASVIRGVPLPVVDAPRLLGHPSAAIGRFVTLKTGDRHVAFAVVDVVGVRQLDAHAYLPPLLAARDAITSLATMDRALVLVLDAIHLVPDAVFAALDRGAS